MNQFINPATLDIVDRVSRRSEQYAEPYTHYLDRPTPKATVSHYADHQSDTDLKPQEKPVRVSLIDPRWAGLVVHSIAVGFVSSVVPLTVYPFLTAYLNMDGTQTLSARALLSFPWIFRPFFRAFMDCTPALGSSQHRPFLVLGWFVTCISLGAIYFIEIPRPFFHDRTPPLKPLVDMNLTELALVNLDAPSHGGVYILLMTVATVGFVVADIAADALIEQIAFRYFPPSGPSSTSPLESAVTAPRIVAMLAAFAFMGVGMSGVAYNGDFDFTLSYNEAMFITGIVSSVPFLFGMFLVEGCPTQRSSLSASLRSIWDVFQSRAVNVVIASRFLGGVLSGTSATPVGPIALYWANVQPMNDNAMSFGAVVVVVFLVLLAEKKGWAINHLRVIVIANVLILVIDCTLTMFTIWDVVRSQWLWIGLPVLEALPSALEYLILNVILGEIADPGMEGLTRELVMAVSFVATSLGVVITKLIDEPFHLSNQDILRDSHNVRVDAMVVFLFAYVGQLLSLLWLRVLPRHGDEARRWKETHTSSSKRLGGLLVGVLVVSVLWSLTTHVLSVISSTSCLRIAGGDGC